MFRRGRRGFGHFMGPMAGFGGPFGGLLAGPMQGLDLTDEQVEKIGDLKRKSFGKFARAKIESVELYGELFQELGKEEIDKGKVRAVAKKIKDHQAQMSESMAENMLSFAELLVPEQRKQLRVARVRQFLGLDDDDHEQE